MRYAVLDTPVGELTVGVDAAGVRAVHFGRLAAAAPGEGDARLLRRAAAELEEYFSGTRIGFDLPMAPPAGSRFEKAVWAAIAAIPYGQMCTYGEIAAQVGDVFAARAVGVACNRNPVPVLVPCHRVVGAGGKLVGFGGGLERKRRLLALEARVRVEREFGQPD
jgi:methylated-DNA-[protein]-cysteine S-methyltransferase